jgi:ribokinase
LNVACVGHVEWLQFARVERVPKAGEIVHANESWEEPGGGGAIAAVQLARLAGAATFFTALGDDERGHRACELLGDFGVRVHAAWRSEPQRQAFTYVDAEAERTITVIGDRLVPHGGDDLPWHDLEDTDAVYVTGADAEALRLARAAKLMTATPRVGPALSESHVALDALILSANDPGERYVAGDLEPAPGCVVWTDGARGGHWSAGEGRTGRFPSAELPGQPADSYGAGDCFAAGATFALGEGRPVEEAVAFGARCGARAMTRPGGWALERPTRRSGPTRAPQS